jgi:hypothetical protein
MTGAAPAGGATVENAIGYRIRGQRPQSIIAAVDKNQYAPQAPPLEWFACPRERVPALWRKETMVATMHPEGLLKPIPFIAVAVLMWPGPDPVAIAADLSDPYSVRALTSRSQAGSYARDRAASPCARDDAPRAPLTLWDVSSVRFAAIRRRAPPGPTPPPASIRPGCLQPGGQRCIRIVLFLS